MNIIEYIQSKWKERREQKGKFANDIAEIIIEQIEDMDLEEAGLGFENIVDFYTSISTDNDQTPKEVFTDEDCYKLADKFREIAKKAVREAAKNMGRK